MKISTAVLVVVANATALVAQMPRPVRHDSLVLTRSAAIEAALANNPQLEVAREQTEQARARRVQAVAVPDPTLTASLDGQPGFLQLGNAQAKNVALGIAVPFPTKFGLRNTIATADVNSAQYSYAALRQQLAAQTSERYDTLLVANKHYEIFRTSRDLAADFLTKTQARFNAGTAAKLDVLRAQVALAQSDNDLIGSDHGILTAADAVDRLIGRPLGTRIILADSLALPPPLPDIESLESAALQARPELASLASQQVGARAATRLAKQFWFPDFTFSAQRDYYNPDVQNYVFSAGISLPFPIFYWQHSRGEISGSQHHEKELTATERDLRAQISQDVRAAFSAADVAIRQAIYIRDALLPSVREAYRVASVSYGLGGSSALDVLSARKDLLAAETQYADALTAANSARADLERAAATPLARLDPRRTP